MESEAETRPRLERCADCGRFMADHRNSQCPRMDTHIVIDADNMERMRMTGHPRLLRKLLAGQATNFAGVSINGIRVVGGAQ